MLGGVVLLLLAALAVALVTHARGTPAWSQQQKLVADDTVISDGFAASVAVSGDTAVVGADRKNDITGAAYVYIRVDGVWTRQGELTANDAAKFDQFGKSVAVSGDTVVVGAHGKNKFTGAAYIFTRSGTTWSQQQKLIADDTVIPNDFGVSVAVSGDTVVIGASPRFDRDNRTSAAHVFTRTNGNWTQQQRLSAGNAVADEAFGVSVAVSGDTAVVGASRTVGLTGAIYIFTRVDSAWTQQQRFTAGDAAGFDQFGGSVAVSGDIVMVSASHEKGYTGAVYVYGRLNGNWIQLQRLTASDGPKLPGFGGSVSVSGDTAVIGGVDISDYKGTAYVFTRMNGRWAQRQRITASDAAKEKFGGSAAMSGDTIVLGGGDISDNKGAVYVFTRANGS
ncbi:MAG: FG-GAP repeat protein [Chloroflexota bacterium]|nr:FG-GAP repeat protein [Chloroflexota bacterium]